MFEFGDPPTAEGSHYSGVIVVMVTRAGRGALPGVPPALGRSAHSGKGAVACWVPRWVFAMGRESGPVCWP